MKKSAIAAIALILVAGAGCAQDAEKSNNAAPPTGGGLTQAPRTDPQPTGSGIAGGSSKPAELTPQLQESDRKTAAGFATKFVEVWANPKTPEAKWAESLKEFHTPEAKLSYKDMTAFGATKLAGEGKLADGATGYKATVKVPTDKGNVDVKLTRESGFSSWLVESVAKA